MIFAGYVKVAPGRPQTGRVKLKTSDDGYTSIFMMFTREIHKFELQIEINEYDPRCFFRSFFYFKSYLAVARRDH